MIDLYVHHIYYTNGTEQHYDSDRPTKLSKCNGFICLKSPNGDETVLNPEYIVCASIKHLTLTEEEYEKRQKLLNNK